MTGEWGDKHVQGSIDGGACSGRRARLTLPSEPVEMRKRPTNHIDVTTPPWPTNSRTTPSSGKPHDSNGTEPNFTTIPKQWVSLLPRSIGTATSSTGTTATPIPAHQLYSTVPLPPPRTFTDVHTAGVRAEVHTGTTRLDRGARERDLLNEAGCHLQRRYNHRHWIVGLRVRRRRRAAGDATLRRPRRRVRWRGYESD